MKLGRERGMVWKEFHPNKFKLYSVLTREMTTVRPLQDSLMKSAKMNMAKVSRAPAKEEMRCPIVQAPTAAPLLIVRICTLLANMSHVEREYLLAILKEPSGFVYGAGVSGKPTGGEISPSATAFGQAAPPAYFPFPNRQCKHYLSSAGWRWYYSSSKLVRTRRCSSHPRRLKWLIAA